MQSWAAFGQYENAAGIGDPELQALPVGRVVEIWMEGAIIDVKNASGIIQLQEDGLQRTGPVAVPRLHSDFAQIEVSLGD